MIIVFFLCLDFFLVSSYNFVIKIDETVGVVSLLHYDFYTFSTQFSSTYYEPIKLFFFLILHLQFTDFLG